MAEPVSMYEKYFKDPRQEPVLIDHMRTPINKRRGSVDGARNRCSHNYKK